jgi:hypothetical protein
MTSVKCASGLNVCLAWQKLEKDGASRTRTDDFGRHLTMLPSRGLRPAQFVPLNARQSVVLRSNASRKVRITRFDVLLDHPSPPSPPHVACRTLSMSAVHTALTSTLLGLLHYKKKFVFKCTDSITCSSPLSPEPPAFLHRHVEQARFSPLGGEQVQRGIRMLS